MLIDLQIHSTYSDGFLSPTAAARFLKKQGVKAAALTDHNTVSGLFEFAGACEKYGIKPIPGLELYVRDGNSRFNLLWYNFNSSNPGLHDLLRESQIRRRRSIRTILHRLIQRGFELNAEEVIDKYNHYVPVNHVVNEIMLNRKNRRLIEKDLNMKSPREEKIISRYFRNKSIGILRETYINFDKITKLKKQIGGQLVLCHPAKYGQIKREKIEKLKKSGLDGLEVISPHHSYGAIMYLQQLADELGLIASGGSDFHRAEGNGRLLQESWDYFKIDSKFLRGVEKIIYCSL